MTLAEVRLVIDVVSVSIVVVHVCASCGCDASMLCLFFYVPLKFDVLLLCRVRLSLVSCQRSADLVLVPTARSYDLSGAVRNIAIIWFGAKFKLCT